MMMTQKKREGGHYSTNNYWASSFALEGSRQRKTQKAVAPLPKSQPIEQTHLVS